jgi:DNA-binding transcriptional MerR regulator
MAPPVATVPAGAAGFRIGALAARSGRSIHAIRWYEAQGLIPGVTRDGGGRRVYNELHVNWLDLMDRLRRTGMSIAQMREYTALVRQGRGTLKQRQDLLVAHRARVRATIADWTAALALIDGKIDYYGEWLATGHRPKILPEERRAATSARNTWRAPRRGARRKV